MMDLSDRVLPSHLKDKTLHPDRVWVESIKVTVHDTFTPAPDFEDLLVTVSWSSPKLPLNSSIVFDIAGFMFRKDETWKIEVPFVCWDDSRKAFIAIAPDGWACPYEVVIYKNPNMDISRQCSEALDLYAATRSPSMQIQILAENAYLVGLSVDRASVTPQKIKAIEEGLKAHATLWRSLPKA